MTFTSFEAVLDEAVSILSSNLGESVRVLKKFSQGKKPSPLDKNTVSVGFKSIKLAGEDGYESVLEIGVFVPFLAGAANAYDLIVSAVKALTESESFPPSDAQIGKISPSKITGSYEVFADIKFLISQSENKYTYVYIDGVPVCRAVSCTVKSDFDTHFIEEYGEEEYLKAVPGVMKHSVEFTFDEEGARDIFTNLSSDEIEFGSLSRIFVLSGAEVQKIEDKKDCDGSVKCVVTLVGVSLATREESQNE